MLRHNRTTRKRVVLLAIAVVARPAPQTLLSLSATVSVRSYAHATRSFALLLLTRAAPEGPRTTGPLKLSYSFTLSLS